MKTVLICAAAVLAVLPVAVAAEETADLPKAFIDGTGPGWQELGE